MMAAPGSSQGPISFGFSRTSRPKLLVVKDEEAEEREYLVGAEGRQLLSAKPAPVSKPLVIPLIHTNRWAQSTKAKENTENAAPQTEDEKVLSQAVKELIAESRQSQEDEHSVPQTNSIPLLMQNRVPSGFEDGEKMDVGLRPESADPADYEAVPVAQYGMAMLRGMGWKEGEGIGRTFKQDVKPLEQTLRPKGLGLGADRAALKELEPKKLRRPLKPGETPEEEVLVLGKGSGVEIKSGAHKDLYGKVEGIDPDNSRAMVKLAIGGKVVTVSEFALRLVSSSEYTKNANDLSRLSKAYQQKKERDAKEEQRELSQEKEQRSERSSAKAKKEQRREFSPEREKRREYSPEREKRREYSPEREKRREYSPEGEKRREYSPEREKRGEYSPEREKRGEYSPEREKRRERSPERERHREKSKNGHSSNRDKRQRSKSPDREKEKKKTRPEPPGWIHRDLKVRFIDKHYKGGKYYNTKMLVEDVLSPVSAVCRTENGRLLEDIKQDMLETVIPKEEGGYVMVVLGQHRGQLGTILHRDRQKSRALVQLMGDSDAAVTFSYDLICHYTGECED